MQDQIHIQGLKVPCHIGVGSEERAHAQELLVDISLVPARPLTGLGDDLELTIDYHQVALDIRELAASRERKLVETLAEDILDYLFQNHQLRQADVRIRKFILPYAVWVGVSLQRKAGGDAAD